MNYMDTLKSVLNAAQCAGGDLSKLPDEELYVLNVTFDDAAYKVVNDWVVMQDAVPTVSAMFAPPQHIWDTEMCPPKDSMFDYLREASTIAHHYAALTANDFTQNPVVALPRPLAAPPRSGSSSSCERCSACPLCAHSGSEQPKLPCHFRLASGLLYWQCLNSLSEFVLYRRHL
jgi:hypothetical protein